MYLSSINLFINIKLFEQPRKLACKVVRILSSCD
nr:MAG TPA: hypothetical protein [Caudoviricetes sp.]